MKKLISFVLMVLLSVASFAQKFNAETKTFSRESTVKTSATMTEYSWEESDSIYPIYVTKNGRTYINKVSKKSGKVYKKYLPEDVSRQLCEVLNIIYVEPKKQEQK